MAQDQYGACAAAMTAYDPLLCVCAWWEAQCLVVRVGGKGASRTRRRRLATSTELEAARRSCARARHPRFLELLVAFFLLELFGTPAAKTNRPAICF